MSLAATSRFSEAADDYARFRPSYPPALVDLILEAAPVPAGGTIVDLGAGTGISTRLFSGRGFHLIGVEPNAEMRAYADAAKTLGARYLEGTAAKTSLPDRSADLVIAAQAFHWFPLEETLGELRRILVPGGAFAAFWNVRGDSPFMQAYRALLGTLGEYEKVPKPEPTLAALEARPELERVRHAELPYAQVLDEAGLLGRAKSSSYVAHAGPGQAAFLAALSQLFEQHQVGGKVELSYRTVVSVFRFRDRA